MKTLIKNGIIVNEGLSVLGSLLLEGNRIGRIILAKNFPGENEYREAVGKIQCDRCIDAEGLHILPGVIDDQVHFREPGNTHKATIASESAAAVLGGVTSFMDMPNNNPPCTTNSSLEGKFAIAAKDSLANYSFYLGATNENIDEITSIDKKRVCGVKVFMGSSTGNMLVNNEDTLSRIFRESPVLIATHCEEEDIIRRNMEEYTARYGEEIPFGMHYRIRSREACISCTRKALDLAVRNQSRLHILHISTADEIEMIKEARKLNPEIMGEVCVHYMWFNCNDYEKYGSKIKCNPAIKTPEDMAAIRKAVKEGVIKVVATDHAPHLKEEKQNSYAKAPSGIPLVQHSLQLMLQMCREGIFTVEEVVARMSHGPAECFNIKGRGFIREGNFADLALVNLNLPCSKTTSAPAYKCGWSPFEGMEFSSSIVHVFVNGTQAVADGRLTGERNAMELEFDR
ncbi:MAG: dihydroorotase [Bacteroidales bacterium]|nr:dihydroorotase [Bacteroidales bacterium]